ncbi:MAG: glycerophosphodiester phosphodiesterase, partial [Candidatus Saccharibacteria bacterium]|nr:glycerophosphodiester phosphodiesterase [Candidatus Saccharibacteria bacterium]
MTKLPLVYAHRGASAYAPENTLPAFQKAIDMHADGIELDIQLTKDNQIVVIHDEWIDRTSTGKGWVKDYTLEELRQFSYNKNFPELGTVTIPTMQEVFDLIKPTNLRIDIELKTGVVFYPKLEEMILAMVKENGMEDRVEYSSFNHYTCVKLHELNPDAYVGFLYMDGTIDIVEYAKKHGANALNPALYNLQYPNMVLDCHQNQIDINAWTVDEKDYMRRCVEMGVRSIITNVPDKVFDVYKEYG